MSCDQPQAEQTIDCSLERVARLPHFLFKKFSNIIVYREGGAHIMMFLYRTS